MNIWEKSGYHQSVDNKMAEGIKKKEREALDNTKQDQCTKGERAGPTG